jgi:hypothetical protein
MNQDDVLIRERGDVFLSLCDRDSSYFLGSHRKKRQIVWIYVIPCRSWEQSGGMRLFLYKMPVWENVLVQEHFGHF